MKILGIDPGSNLGICILDINSLTIDTYCFKIIDLIEVYDNLNFILDKYKPILIGMETAFVNHKFPHSGIYLSRIIGAIELSLKLNDRYSILYKFPPKYIKAFYGSGDFTKNDLAKVFKLDCSTHEIDATAIAYILYSYYKSNPYLLYRFLQN